MRTSVDQSLFANLAMVGLVQIALMTRALGPGVNAIFAQEYYGWIILTGIVVGLSSRSGPLLWSLAGITITINLASLALGGGIAGMVAPIVLLIVLVAGVVAAVGILTAHAKGRPDWSLLTENGVRRIGLVMSMPLLAVVALFAYHARDFWFGAAMLVMVATVIDRQRIPIALVIVATCGFAVRRIGVGDYWSWVLLIAASSILLLAKKEQRNIVAFVAVVSSLPVLQLRTLAMTSSERAAIADDQRLTVVFDNDDPAFPSDRMEMFCTEDVTTSTRYTVVTPHMPATSARVIRQQPGSDVRQYSVQLGGEAPDQSIYRGSNWYLVEAESEKLVRVDLATGYKTLLAENATPSNVYYMSASTDYNFALISHDRMGGCTERDLRTGEKIRDIQVDGRFSSTAHCTFVNDDQIIYTGKGYEGLIGRAGIPGQPRADNLTATGPFYQHAFSATNNTVYLPHLWLGTITAVDVQSWQQTAKYQAEFGVRSVLVGCGRDEELYSWNYQTGVIHRYQRGFAEPIDTWRVGPILRTVNWDCGCDALLAVSSHGGFRIPLPTPIP